MLCYAASVHPLFCIRLFQGFISYALTLPDNTEMFYIENLSLKYIEMIFELGLISTDILTD